MLPVEFDAALAMINTSRWQKAALKLRVLLYVKLVSGLDDDMGTEIGVRTVAKGLGTSIRSASVVIDLLLEDRVLVLVAGSAGSRAASYAIEPRVARWDVPWTYPVEIVETRLKIASGRLVEADLEPEPAFARVTDRAQPFRSRVTARAPSRPVARPEVRAKRALAYTPPRAADEPEPAGAPISYFEGQSIDRTTAFNTVKGAITSRFPGAVAGEYAERVAFAIADLDVGPIVEHVLAGQPGLGLELQVQRVEQFCALQRHNRSAEPTARSSWAADPDCSTCGGSGVEDIRPGYARPCLCRTPTTVVPA